MRMCTWRSYQLASDAASQAGPNRVCACLTAVHENTTQHVCTNYTIATQTTAHRVSLKYKGEG